jgi:hypothetical protein
MTTYGLPTGSQIFYGSKGFPEWVYELCSAFGSLKASTYPGHQEGSRAEAGFAPNPKRQNRGIDFAGTVAEMDAFATYLLSIKGHLEQAIWQNPETGRHVGIAGGDDVSATSYYASDLAGHRDHVHVRTSKVLPLPATLVGAVKPVDDARPDFNEYPIWSPSNESRGGFKPDLFLLHTEEGGPVKDGADRLARWLGDPRHQVSYHYTISEDPVDHGVTVVDVVDTARASWSALSANRRSINLVFAGSRAAWSREEWLKNARAIDVAAYLAAQDCRTYPSIPKRVIKPPYGPPGGISDHRYVTKYLRDGTHTDVGGPMAPPWTGFPWDVFEAAFNKHAGITAAPVTPVTPPTPQPQWPRDATDRQLLEDIWTRLTKPATP